MGSLLTRPGGIGPAAPGSCNGNAALCGRKYSEVTFVGAHDSPFVGVLPMDNQHLSPTDQLKMGVRYLQSQTHNKNGVIEMCHTSCGLQDSGSLANYLSPIKSWLDSNPTEIVTLLITNGDNIPVSQFGSVFASVGLDNYAYAPGSTLKLDQWPTLRNMVDSGKRLVVFMDYHADTNSVPYILDEFLYYFETPYDTTDRNFAQCTIDRPEHVSADGRMSIVNHFLDVELLGILMPDEISAPQTNSLSSITKQTALCEKAYGRTPNVVLLDWIDVGDAMSAQNQLNHL